MGYTKLNELLGDDIKMKSFISNITSGCIDMPYIVKETVKILDDEHPFFNIITDNNKKALCAMLSMYFDTCFALYIEDISLDKLLKYGKIEVYKIDASDGLRYATSGEIAQGVRGLIGENIYPAGEDVYKKLCLLQWSFNGVSYYYRQAGYNLDYDSNKKVVTTLYEMIQNCALDFKHMMEWVDNTDEFDKALKKIKKMQKSRGYKYANFAKDEIKEDITIKQLLYNIDKIFPRNSPNAEYRKALALTIKASKNKQMLSPLEVSTLRSIYDKFVLSKDNKGEQSKVNDELKEKCEKLLSERFSGKINQKHFAYVIIDTLKKNNYTKCSPKQYSIIEEAYKIITKDSITNVDAESENRVETEIISDDDIDLSLSALSNAIGEGLFEE